MRCLIAAICSLMVLAMPAKAEYRTVFRSGNWDGLAFYNDESRQFRSCGIQAAYQNGITLTFVLFVEGQLNLFFFRSEGYGAIEGMQMHLYIDNAFLYQDFAKRNNNILIIPLPTSGNALSSIRKGKVLKVVTNQNTLFFNLTGTTQAMDLLYACVRQNAGTMAQGQPQQADKKEKEKEKQDDAAKLQYPRQQLLSFVTTFLSEAGLINYRILPYEDTKDLGDIVWQIEDGSLGSLIAMRAGPRYSLEEISASLLKSSSQGCPGDFASGKKAPRYFRGAEIYKVATSCRAGPKSFRAEYSLILLPNGSFMRLMTGRVGSETGGEEFDTQAIERREEAILRTTPLN